MTLVFAQNRSLHNSVNMLEKLERHGQIRVSLDGVGQPMLPTGESLVLTGAELEAIRDFIDPRKLKAKHLKRSKDDGIFPIDGRSVADPGFITALQKISKSYEQPEWWWPRCMPIHPGAKAMSEFEGKAENICEAPGDRQGVESASLLR